MGKIQPYVDVRSSSDLPKFESMLKVGPVFVLVYADWCGHCTRFKEKMWNEVANSPNKKVNTAAVHYNMVDQTSMKNTPIEGYPTLFEVKPTPKANTVTAVATPQTKEELETMVGMNTMDPNLILSQRVTQNSQNATNDTFEPEPSESLPPEPEPETENVSSAPQGGGGVKTGGSLMETLLKLSADSAHALVLAGSAAELSRRWKKRHTRRKHSGKKKATRRR